MPLMRSQAWVKIIARKQTGQILGAHIIGPQATDLVAEAVLAVKKSIRVEDLATTVHAHPTLAEIFGDLSFHAAGIF